MTISLSLTFSIPLNVRTPEARRISFRRRALVEAPIPVACGCRERERRAPKRKSFRGAGVYTPCLRWLSSERTVAKSSHIVGERRRRGRRGKGKQGEKGKEAHIANDSR